MSEESEREAFDQWMDMVTKINMPPEEMLEECPAEVMHTLFAPRATEPHDPYRRLPLLRHLEPGQVLVKLPGEDAWRIVGKMHSVLDAAEVVQCFQENDKRRYAYVDEDRRIMGADGPIEEE